MQPSPVLASRVLAPEPAVEAPPRLHAIMAAARPGTAMALFDRPAPALLTAVGVALLVLLAVELARSTELLAALWGASGLAAAMWLRAGRDCTLAHDLAFGGLMAVGVMAGEFLAGNGLTLSLVFTVANMMEIVLAVVLARRLIPSGRLADFGGVARFMGVAALAPIPAGLFAIAVLKVLAGQDALTGLIVWWQGHALGLAVVGCAVLAMTRAAVAPYRRPIRLLEAAALMALLGAVCLTVFWRFSLPLSFLVLPVLLLIAARLRLLGTALALAVIAVVAVGWSMAGRGPFSAGFDPAGAAAMAQLLVLAGYLPIVLVAGLLDERDALAERARAGQARAERASAAKSRLLANVAHEIKSPVGGVIGIGELMAKGQLGPVTTQQAEMAEMLVKTARQIEALSHDLLDVARAEAGAVRVDLRPTDVRGVIEDVRRAQALRPDAKGVRLDLDIRGDDLVALADSQRLAQVLTNLGSNALKYGRSGGVVTFRAFRAGARVRIEVADRGPGLSLEKQSQLFEPFNRLGLERSAVEGHGVGLALAKRLVELQGGALGVISAPGQGACFWIELPTAV